MHRALFVFLQVACFAFLGRIVTGHPSGHGSFRVIGIRQSSDIPTQCQSSCDPVLPPLENESCTPSVCCNNPFIQNLTSCFECVGNLSGTTNYSAPQATVDAIFEACAAVGINVSDPTLPGQNSHRSLSGLPTSSTAGSGGSSTPASSSLHQSTITAITFTSPISLPSQNTITALSTSTGASPGSPASTSAGSNSGSLGRAWDWTVIIGSVGASWALGLIV
ncbi:hypothetical protein GYMLUDRAFT_843745 [Collybiopsis luxurians FD-317 M1]|uniref:Extracellular membrane protein CFEM domain-containing protein n=1 Tax=Collybiopsis luxurians FD-317 M1 TaxID=944289 RepID=A0A0D0BZL4_9AGAR|nr:hypothetical protein GYMLUDRAFT_843745 [Collybiopsis luxurians FD-317 M1]